MLPTELAIVVIAFAPGAFWLRYFYKKDVWKPEPKRLIIKTFFLGLAVALPVALIEYPFRSSLLLLSVIIAPIVEECAKFSVVRFTVYNNVEFDEPIDGIEYAAAAAIGFASIENAGYLLKAFHSPGEGAVAYVFAIRAILSVPGHVLFSSMWGYALGLAKFPGTVEHVKKIIQSPVRRWGSLKLANDEEGIRDKDEIPGKKDASVFIGLLLAMGLHASFNLLSEFASGVLLIAMAYIWKLFRKKLRIALDTSALKDKELATSRASG
jgi:RsiW-degrading membrane proteinase PrsW (M82 family)